jgi:hypothetical protein
MFLAFDSHYHLMPGKLLRRRVVLTLFSFAIMLFAVYNLARSQAATQRLNYKYRFTQVAIELKEPLSAAGGQRLLAMPVSPSEVDSRTVVGYEVPVPMSQDYFLLVPMPYLAPHAAGNHLGAVRIPLTEIDSVTRNTGSYDQNDTAAPEGSTFHEHE